MPQRAKRHVARFKRAKPIDSVRPDATRRGYDHRWKALRLSFLADNPICVSCADRGLVVEATIVDHIDGKGPQGERGFDRDNLQSLCKTCHDRKTATQDGGFGHARS